MIQSRYRVRRGIRQLTPAVFSSAQKQAQNQAPNHRNKIMGMPTVKILKTPPRPIKVRKNLLFHQLPKHYREAVKTQAEDSEFDEYLEVDAVGKIMKYRIERHKTSDILDRMFRQQWDWPSNFPNLDYDDDIKRVKKIIRLIKKGHSRWPYFSYLAPTMKELWVPNVWESDYGETEIIPNHGDGWHRMMAQEHLGFKTVDIVF